MNASISRLFLLLGAMGCLAGPASAQSAPVGPRPAPAPPAPAPAPAPAEQRRPEAPTRSITINDLRLCDEDCGALDRLRGGRVPDGAYWYDRYTGAAGRMSGPCLGFLPPGLDLGTLRADCSGGGTGVFVNGRELHPIDVQALSRIVEVRRGRYWMDAWGTFGAEGGPPIDNLLRLAQVAQQRAGGYGGGQSWQRTISAGGDNTYVGGDGSFFYFMDGKSSYYSGD